MKKTVERIPLPPKLVRVMELVRQEMRKTGKRPNACFKGLGLSDFEKHRVLSEFAYHAALARKANARRRYVEEKGAMLPSMFVTTALAKTTNMGSAFVTLPTQPIKKDVVQDFLPGIATTNFFDDRPHNWRKRRK